MSHETGKKPYAPSRAKLVLVEGKDEVGLFKQLCEYLGLTGIEIKDYGGKHKLREFLKGLVLAASFRQVVTSLALTRDADGMANDAFKSVTDAARCVDLKAPSKPGAVGRGRPKVHVLILPDGSRPGMLEDVCLESVRNQPVMECVDKFFHCVHEVGEPLPRPMSKAKLHAYLATRSKPGLQLGQAAGKGTWPFGAPAFEPIRKLLTSL